MVTCPPQHQEDWNDINLLFFSSANEAAKPPAQPCINSHHCKRFAARFSLRIWRECNRWSSRWHTSFVFFHFVFVFFYILYLCILRQFWKCNGWWIRWQSNAMEVNSGLTSTSSNKFGARVTTRPIYGSFIGTTWNWAAKKGKCLF